MLPLTLTLFSKAFTARDASLAVSREARTSTAVALLRLVAVVTVAALRK